RARTIEAVSGLVNLVMLPMWLLSGVFFSSERFPDAAQPYIRALPLTALNDALRGVMNEGKGLAAVAPQLAVLMVWGVVSFVIALKIFRWK
ncbi:MAG: ABC transporter permease, partial [Thermoanaerobaculia bacterium]